MTDQCIAIPADIPEFKSAIDNYDKGVWFADRWRTFRLRYGIYEQRQSGEHMVRAKVPGGRLSFSQTRAIAKSNADHAGGDIHITTRQGVQFYFVKQKNLTGLIETLNIGGVTTREASGNTFRAMIACPEAGFCKHQHVNAADVAERITKAWLRNPMVQHMPRKFKTAVSGCEQDCGLSLIDDLGYIATERNGEKGFRVVVGGGLGIQPFTAIEVFDFVTEFELLTVQEAIARLHIKHSSRANKNRSRIKFLVKKFGAEEFIAMAHKEFAALKTLAPPAWDALDWAGPKGTGENVFVEVPMGWLSSAQFEGVANLAEAAGGSEIRLTRTQNLIALDLDVDKVEAFVTGIRNLALDASGREHALKDLTVCPGTSTCAIGITDSHILGESLIDAQAEFTGLKSLKVRVSGCHNSCSQHHIGDIGFHGMAKKINGKPAPHYQIHLGGSPENHGMLGPIIAVRHVKESLKVMLADLGPAMDNGETVREWADRLGKDGLKELLVPIVGTGALDPVVHVFDLGSDHEFEPPATATGECAAGAVVAEHLVDQSFVARSDTKRSLDAGLVENVSLNLKEALRLPAQRLLVIAGEDKHGTDVGPVLDAVRTLWSHNSDLMAVLDRASRAVTAAETSTATVLEALPVLAAWQDATDVEVERIIVDVPNYLAGAAQ
ncbi:MAG: nitrite/sulfite reductase [Magnetovibrio sp.]|nr:nitrite/sulfite reductase [Magnetovibrio sp.]